MKTKEEAINACLAFGGVYLDYPFDDNWALIRHNKSKKAFAMIFIREGLVWVNCKALPENNEIRRSVYPAVVPAYHMNKLHWSSLILDGSMSDEQIMPILEESYDLTK